MPTLQKPVELHARPSAARVTLRLLVISTLSLLLGALAFGVIVVALTD